MPGYAVSPGDGLHERVRPHGFVNVEGGEALDVEAGQPNRADDGHPERMIRVFKRSIYFHSRVSNLKALLHPGAVGDDVEVPLLEIGDFVLCLTDNDLDGSAPRNRRRFCQGGRRR